MTTDTPAATTRAQRAPAATQAAPTAAPPIPGSFLEYLKSFGPGLVVALTWLGASDLVNSSVAGADYGYALMWALVIALLARYAFVNIVAKYELCNERDETVMAGMFRIHKVVPVIILILALLLSHSFMAYLIRGLGETMHALAGGFGAPWVWSLAWVAAIFVIMFRGGFKTLERIFYVFLATLSVVFIGMALWVSPSPASIMRGVFLFEVPRGGGDFKPALVVVALVGALAGSLPNLFYPYFIRQKGWSGPQYRRVQSYDLLFGVMVLIVLDLSVWIVAAEVLHPKGMHVRTLDDLAQIFVMILGPAGKYIFHAGVLAVIATTAIGTPSGFGYMCQDIATKLVRGPQASTPPADMRLARTYRAVVIWSLISPLIWSIPSMPGIVTLTIVVNAAAVTTTPLLAGILWYLTASSRFIGAKYRNNAWENLTMAVLFGLALYATWQAAASLI